MKLTKNKKSEEGSGMAGGWLVGLIIIIALIVFGALWYSGMATKMIAIFTGALK